MLSRSAIARVLLLILAAALAAALIQHYWPSARPAPEPQIVEAPVPVQPPSSEPAPAPVPPPPPAPVPAPAPAPAVAEPRPVPGAPAPPPVQAAPPAPVGPLQDRSAVQAEIDAAEERAEPPARDLVDLNTAPVDVLNRLKGGGAIGRAIVQHRPYASVDQLLSKRVLSRAVFQRIKDQVTVR